MGGTAGSPNQAGTGGMQTGFGTLPGVDPSTPLDRLSSEQIVQACADFARYFESQVPDADLLRALCVQDAVFNKGATTVAQCQDTSAQCIATAPTPAPTECAAPGSGFTCPATLGLFQQCASDLTASERTLVSIYVCESIDDPNIQQKLDAAWAPQASCTSFEQACPSFFPTPMTMP